ncbi:hypothetical protein SAMN05421866_1305 [Chryseobacterium oranimense]|uniref:Outer membrane protein beta-barrel domain-containing protein n=1 Tax=Chryseobacterium oranimense TaxID=421058 RepID=A0A1M5M3L8_9FLAO|nr:hypothetical protein [Chryseobacterium oranimense]SHG71499.1 hypothetical protein SAMN05421866_1305 [Chryseobacterium oranimense]
MKSYIFCMLLCCIQIAAQSTEAGQRYKKSLIETGGYMNFSPEKVKQSPGFYVGYWYRYPVDENKTHLEIGGNFGYSSSIYDFDYGKRGAFYHIDSREFILNLGGRLVKEYTAGNTRIEWVSELSFHNLFFDGKTVPDEPETEDDENTINISIDAESIATLKFGQGIRLWKNNIGLGIQASYMPYRLWYRNTVPKGFNSFSVETGIYFKF